MNSTATAVPLATLSAVMASGKAAGMSTCRSICSGVPPRERKESRYFLSSPCALARVTTRIW